LKKYVCTVVLTYLVSLPAMAQTSGQPKADCGKLAAEVQKQAESCLTHKDAVKRKACFDKVGQFIGNTPGNDQCQSGLNPLRIKFQEKEAAKYPGAPPSI
jgi:hypothetical protein